MLSRLLTVAAVIVAASASSAGAVATLVTPAPGAKLTSTHPVFSWTLPAGEVGESISVARSPKINPATGDFMLADLQDSDILELGSTKWSPERAMPAGTYYWHIASRTETQRHMFSPTSSFVIKPAISKLGIQVKTYSAQRTFLITTSWNANERTVTLVARLFAGSKLLGERKQVTDNFLIDARKLDLSTWILPPTVKKGTRLRFVVSLKSKGGAKATKTKVLRAP